MIKINNIVTFKKDGIKGIGQVVSSVTENIFMVDALNGSDYSKFGEEKRIAVYENEVLLVETIHKQED